MDQQRSLKPGRCEISRSSVGDVPNTNDPQHGRRVHDPRHQTGQQGQGGGRAGDPGRRADVSCAHNQPQIINNSKNISSIHYVTHCVFVR